MSDQDFLGLMAAAGMERSELRTEKHKALLANLEALNAQLAGKPQLTDERRRQLIDQADAAIDSNEKDIARR